MTLVTDYKQTNPLSLYPLPLQVTETMLDNNGETKPYYDGIQKTYKINCQLKNMAMVITHARRNIPDKEKHVG